MPSPVQVAQFIAYWYYVIVRRPSDTEDGAQGLELPYNNAAASETVGGLSPEPVSPS